MPCSRCGADHATETCKSYLIFQGYAFAPPYLCMCCGNPVSPRRWLHTHTCGDCEWGGCQEMVPAHPVPTWCETSDGTEAFELYVEYVEAIPRARI